MPWVYSFIVSWIMFFILVDYKQLQNTIWIGIITLALASFVDWGGQHLNLYTFNEVIIPWAGCSAFYKFGPVFTMGIIFSQYVPKYKYLQILHILIFTAAFITLEYGILQTGVAVYVHWSLAASVVIDLLTFSSLSWITLVFIRSNSL